MTPLFSLNQCKFQAQRKLVTSRLDVTQMFINKLWCADYVIDMLSSDLVKIIQMKRKGPHVMGEGVSKDSAVIPVSYPTPSPAQVWFYNCCSFFVEDPEYSHLQHRWKITYRGTKVPNLCLYGYVRTAVKGMTPVDILNRTFNSFTQYWV